MEKGIQHVTTHTAETVLGGRGVTTATAAATAAATATLNGKLKNS